MRPIWLPLTGTTDAKGNASLPVPLERTGDWRNIKLALGTIGPAEWAVLKTGSPLTFGRGRRVTLGPELLEPQDTITVSVTGGPVSAAISGSVSGMGGSFEEIAPGFAPAPNTIALDSSIPRQRIYPDGSTAANAQGSPSFTVAGGATSPNQRFTLQAGAVAVRILATANGLLFSYQLFVGGHQSNEQYYGSTSAPGSVQVVPNPTLPFTIPIEIDQDAQLDMIVTNTSANPISFFVSELYAPEAPGQAGASQSVFIPTPAPWQAATAFKEIAAVSVAGAGGVQNIIPATAGLTLYLHGYSFSQDNANAASRWTLQDTTGVGIADFLDAAVRHVFDRGDFRGFPLATGVGVQMVNGGGAASFLSGFLSYATG